MSAVRTDSARERLVDAAFTLFAEQGFEQTTIDAIARTAGVGRTTFFRHYRSKEDVIFPDHEAMLARARDQLAVAAGQRPIADVAEAVRGVLVNYLDEGRHARQRYALTSTVPTLRDREIVSVAAYQRLFRDHLVAHLSGGQSSPLRSELIASAVVTGHNHVLRRWLREQTENPLEDLDRAMLEIADVFGPNAGPAAEGSVVLVVRDGRHPDQVAAAIARALGPG